MFKINSISKNSFPGPDHYQPLPTSPLPRHRVENHGPDDAERVTARLLHGRRMLSLTVDPATKTFILFWVVSRWSRSLTQQGAGNSGGGISSYGGVSDARSPATGIAFHAIVLWEQCDGSEQTRPK
eukprot:1337489-Amorphochlora_amoeboformis.AAC.1